MTVRMIIDTDGGVDDAVALWWALDEPDVEVIGITVVAGNVDVAQATRNVCRVLHAHGSSHVPVFQGASRPLAGAPSLRPADFIHGSDGLGDCGVPDAPFGAQQRSALEFLADAGRAEPGAFCIVTLGPLTNIAAAILADRLWSTTVGALTVMGGVVGLQGNAQPMAEANVAHDPSAAGIVVRAPWVRRPLIVPLDATHVATFGPDEFGVIERRSNAASVFLHGPLTTYRRFAGTFCPPGECPCHDLLAVMGAVHEDVLVVEEIPLAVQASPGPAWGATIADRRVSYFARSGTDGEQAVPEGFHPWRIATSAHTNAFRVRVRRLFGD